MQLVKYEAARQALSEAKSVDEVKQIKDKSEAMRAYARQAKDFEMASWASEIRIRAERRLGEMLKAQKEAGLMNKGIQLAGKNENGDYRRSQAETADIPTLSDMGISKSMSSRAQQIADVPEEEFEQIINEHREQQQEITSATMQKLTKPHVANNSGNNEWYTPIEYVEAAKDVMRTIDLDPASCELANKTVGAVNFYSKEDCGLEKNWAGNVWMNPPYESGLIGKFIDKLVGSEDVKQYIVLVNNATETSWFQTLLKNSDCVCFPSKRIKFIDTNGNPSGAPLQGQAILYKGQYRNKFIGFFGVFGAVMVHG